MIEIHIWVYFLTLVGYITAGFIKGWSTSYLTAGTVIFGLPTALIAVLTICDKFEETAVKKEAEKLLKNIKINIEKVYESDSWYRVYHCTLMSEKINTKCAITYYKGLNKVHSIRLSPEWIKANKDIYQKYGWALKETIAEVFEETLTALGADRYEENSSYSNNISQKDFAEIMGLKERRLCELKKLNDLIPELQKLVEEGKLTTKAGEQFAYLEPEQQKELYNTLGDAVADLKRSEIESLRKQMEEYRKQYLDMQNKITALEKQKKEAEEIKEELEKKIAEIKPEVIEKVPDDYEELKSTLKTIKEQSEQLTKRLNELEQEKNRLDELRRKAIEEKRQALEEKARAEAEVKNIRYELEQLKQQYGIEAKKQCELADKLIEEIKKITANATGILELMDIEKLPDYKYNDFSTTLLIFIDKLEKFYQSAEQKARSGKVVCPCFFFK